MLKERQRKLPSDLPFYVNQLEHEDIPYETGLNATREQREKMIEAANIKCAGCGICSGSMLITELTGRRLSLEEYRDLSYISKANLDPGTDMNIYGHALCERFDLNMETSDRAEDLIACLEHGGRAIINVGGDHEGHKGVFSDVGHYIFARHYLKKTAEFEILDPAFRPGKFDSPEVSAQVRTEGFVCYCKTDLLTAETENRSPGYYLFRLNS